MSSVSPLNNDDSLFRGNRCCTSIESENISDEVFLRHIILGDSAEH